jgi:hypothetical protein
MRGPAHGAPLELTTSFRQTGAINIWPLCGQDVSFDFLREL